MEGEIPFLFNDWFTMSSEKIKNGLESIFISCDLRSCHSTKRLRFSQSESVFFALLLGNQRFATLILSAQWVRAIANHGLVLTKERKNIKGGGSEGRTSESLNQLCRLSRSSFLIGAPLVILTSLIHFTWHQKPSSPLQLTPKGHPLHCKLTPKSLPEGQAKRTKLPQLTHSLGIFWTSLWTFLEVPVPVPLPQIPRPTQIGPTSRMERVSWESKSACFLLCQPIQKRVWTKFWDCERILIRILKMNLPLRWLTDCKSGMKEFTGILLFGNGKVNRRVLKGFHPHRMKSPTN